MINRVLVIITLLIAVEAAAQDSAMPNVQLSCRGELVSTSEQTEGSEARDYIVFIYPKAKELRVFEQVANSNLSREIRLLTQELDEDINNYYFKDSSAENAEEQTSFDINRTNLNFKISYSDGDTFISASGSCEMIDPKI